MSRTSRLATARPWEVRLHQFADEESTRRGVTPQDVINDVKVAGKYPGIKLRRVKRCVFVDARAVSSVPGPSAPQAGEVPLKQWLIEQAPAFGIRPASLYNRIRKGAVAWPPVRRVNIRKVMVKV